MTWTGELLYRYLQPPSPLRAFEHARWLEDRADRGESVEEAAGWMRRSASAKWSNCDVSAFVTTCEARYDFSTMSAAASAFGGRLASSFFMCRSRLRSSCRAMQR